jgi:hypothetical protein
MGAAAGNIATCTVISPIDLTALLVFFLRFAQYI